MRASVTVTSPHPSTSWTARATAAEVRGRHTITIRTKIVTRVFVRKAVMSSVPLDVCQSNSIFHDPATDDSPFFDNDMPTMRSSSSSSEGLPHVIGLNWEGSVESNEVNAGAQHRVKTPDCI